MHYKNPKHVCDETNDQMSETHFLYKKIFNLLQNSRIEITVWYVLFDLDGVLKMDFLAALINDAFLPPIFKK